jgi:hypothetical protein
LYAIAHITVTDVTHFNEFTFSYQLEEKGLSLSFVLHQMFYQNIVEAIEQYHAKMDAALAKLVTNENWTATKYCRLC